MANNRVSLDPNAPPYLQIPPKFYFYVLHPYQFCTYYIHLQPSHRKSFPVLPQPPPPPPPPPPKQITFSLASVPSGPRIPKSRRCKKMIWVPKSPEDKASVENRKVGFPGKRWKNGRRGYQKSLPVETDTTSLMIKNIPNKYTRKLLIQTLDVHCEAENKKMNDGGGKQFVSAYDFVYLPIDFKQRANAGFAFVNFTTPEAALGFRDAFNGKRWNLFESSKVAAISRARIQGKVALINNCKAMDFTYGSEEDMPVWFSPPRDGCGRAPSKMFAVGRFPWGVRK